VHSSRGLFWARRISAGLAAFASLSCGRAGYAPLDAALDGSELDSAFLDVAGADAPGLDAPGLDAPASDATGLDATGLDATGLDARGPELDATLTPDAVLPDAAQDAAVPAGCRVRWAQRATGPTNELVLGAFPADDARIYVGAQGNAGATFAGAPCRRCFVSLTRDGVLDVVGGDSTTVLQWVAGPGGVASESVEGGAYVVRRHALGSLADLGVLGTVRNDGSTGSRRLAVRGAGVLYAPDVGGTITGVEDGPVTTTNVSVALVYYEGGARRWGRVIESGTTLSARILPSGDIGLYFRNTSTGPVCFEGRCVPRLRGAGLVFFRPYGTLLAFPEGSFGVASTVLDDRGVMSEDSLADTLERRDAAGTVIWSRPYSVALNGSHMLLDEARGRIVVFTAVDASSAYDGVPLRPATADGTGLALPELEAASGELRGSLVFGSDRPNQAFPLAVGAGGGCISRPSSAETWTSAQAEAGTAACKTGCWSRSTDCTLRSRGWNTARSASSSHPASNDAHALSPRALRNLPGLSGRARPSRAGSSHGMTFTHERVLGRVGSHARGSAASGARGHRGGPLRVGRGEPPGARARGVEHERRARRAGARADPPDERS